MVEDILAKAGATRTRACAYKCVVVTLRMGTSESAGTEVLCVWWPQFRSGIRHGALNPRRLAFPRVLLLLLPSQWLALPRHRPEIKSIADEFPPAVTKGSLSSRVGLPEEARAWRWHGRSGRSHPPS